MRRAARRRPPQRGVQGDVLLLFAEELAHLGTVTFAFHGYDDIDPAESYGPLQAELEGRGFPCRYVRSRRRRTRTPHRHRAQVMVDALRDVEGDVALVGLSNEGLFLPLVAAARPVRRIVMLNALVPRPGRSFREATQGEPVYANFITRFLGWLSPGTREVCPLAELPRVEYVYIAGAADDALRPEWEQSQARDVLHVEPVVIPGAGHSDILLDHVDEVADAATRDLVSGVPPEPARPATRPAGAPGRQPELAGVGTLGLLVSSLVPLGVYLGLHASGASDTRALGLAWLVPVIWTVGASGVQRRVNLPGLLGTFAYGAALFISVFLGGGALPLKLHRAVVSATIGLVCLVSVALRRPVFMLVARRAAARLRRGRAVERPAMQRRMRRLTILVGVATLANAALQTVLALTLSTSAYLLTTTVVHVAFTAGLVGALIGWLLWTGRA